MKILHFIYDHINNPWVGGGGAVRCYEIYKRLSQKGHKIHVISGNYPEASSYTANDNWDYEFIGSNKNYIISVFSYAFNSFKLLKNIYMKYDIVIEDFAPWNPIFSFRFQRYRPIILQVHHKEGFNIIKKYNIFGIPFYIVEKNYPKYYKYKIAVSKESAKKFSIDAKIISNGIDERYLEEKIKFSGNYCLFIGRIDFYNKGLDILIKVFNNKKIPLYIVGIGKDVKKLKVLIKNNLTIKYLGRIIDKEKVELIKNSKFLIMPSRFEGQGIVALEAAALGKPVIVSDIPELKYVIDNGFGISFKCGDAEDLKKKVEYLWNNQDLIEKLGKKGREYAKNFTWDKIANLYEEYLLEVYKDFYKK